MKRAKTFAAIRPALLIAAALTVVPAAGNAQSSADEVAVLDEIVVVAHKSARSVREIAANVTSISRDEIDANLATSVADVFRYVPGIDYEASGSRFGTEGINIRGIGGNRVAMLVDGVPLSDQFDVGSFSNATRDFINAGMIQHVEVLHGPASALYGSAAIGGVVAVSTPDPADLLLANGFGGEASATWRDADRSAHANAMLAFGGDTAGILVGGSLRTGSELESAAAANRIDLRDYDRQSLLAKFVGDDRRGGTWRIGLIHQDSAVQSALNSVLGSGRYRTTSALEGDDDYTMNLYSLTYEFGAPDGWIDSGLVRVFSEDVAIAQKTLDERALSAQPTSIDRFFSFEQDIRGIELNLQKSAGGPHASHKFAFGFDYREKQTAEYRDGLSTSMLDGSATNVILGEVFPLRDFPLSTSRETGAYVEDAVNVGDWTMIAAVRADRYELSPRNDAMYAEDYPFASPVSLAESDLSPKLGLIYRLNAGTDVYLQYAHGFRAPPYEDANIGLEIPFFNYRAIPNPDLKSESSHGYELGVRWQGAESGMHLSVFRTSYRDFIESKVRLGTDPVSGRVLFQSQNIARTVIEGVEAGGRVDLPGVLDRLHVDGSLYLARGRNRDNGEALNSIGPAQAVIGISWTAAADDRQLRLQATLTAAWDERDESAGALFKPAGHAVFDLYFMQRLGARTTMRAGLLNVTDRSYWNWSDVRGLAGDDPVLPNLAQPGRNFSLSVNVGWQ